MLLRCQGSYWIESYSQWGIIHSIVVNIEQKIYSLKKKYLDNTGSGMFTSTQWLHVWQTRTPQRASATSVPRNHRWRQWIRRPTDYAINLIAKILWAMSFERLKTPYLVGHPYNIIRIIIMEIYWNFRYKKVLTVPQLLCIT